MISIDSWIKKQKTYICMILVIGCFGSAEIVYSQNICIINDIDDFLLMNRLNTSQLSNEIRITSGKIPSLQGRQSTTKVGVLSM